MMKALFQCPVQYMDNFAYGIVALRKENIFDQEHIDFLLVYGGKYAAFVGNCLELLKRADQNTGELFNKDNKLRIMKHVNDSGTIFSMMWDITTRSNKLVLNEANFNMILKYVKFSKEILAVIWAGADQATLDGFIKEIDRQVELQPRPFMQGMRPVNASNPGIGRFFHAPHSDPKNLCEKIFDFLPNPEIPKPKLG